MAKFSRGHAANKKVIASCALNGVGIESLEGAPNFRFTPVGMMERGPFDSSPPAPPRDSFKGRDNGGPSGHGSVLCGRGKPKNIRNWNPARTSLDPQYSVGMAGDDYELTEARAAYAAGDPAPLREYLAGEADARRKAALAAAYEAPFQMALAA